MPLMRMDSPPQFALEPQDGSNQLTLRTPDGAVAHVFVLEPDVVRLLVLPNGSLQFPRTWAIAPGQADVPCDGRDRFDLSGFSLPKFALTQSANTVCIATERVRLSIALKGLRCTWEVMHHGVWQQAATDRPTQAYNFGWWDQRIYHYLERTRGEQYFGLGERSGDADRAGRRLRMCNLDPMGYSARSTDPLYKHIPFYLTRKPDSGLVYGLFYDTLSECSFDMGQEMDNYHGPYRYFVAEHGDLDVYFVAGSGPAEITQRYTWLTGRPVFSPRYALGYSGSTMRYTDAPDAQERMGEFLQNCQEHNIACDSFHLSSGYTSIANKRYVFNWNRDKFPDPAGFAQSYLARGVRVCANIKPALLLDHPLFQEAAAAGLLIQNPDGTPAQVQFWDECGAYLDFTNPQTIKWWQAQVTESLLKVGIAATWNDNNEYEIWNTEALMHGFGQPRKAVEARPLQTLLMMQASHQAQAAFAPNERPWLVSRSGAPGMQRHVQTWSGDNYTSWETLRYNIRMGLGLAMSGVSNTGHDIGGFSGPAPGEELLLRWVQFGIFLPRFSIHSWNDDGTVNEPWMYPAITPTIRALIALRVRLMPYLYHLLWRSHHAYEPMIRPTYHDFPNDAQSWVENDDMLLGPDLLVAAVVEPGQIQRRVWLPAGSDWMDFWTARAYLGGQWLRLDAPLHSSQPVLLARAGCAIPLNTAPVHFGSTEDQRGFQVFPLVEGVIEAQCFEDDGHSRAYARGEYGFWNLVMDCSPTALRLSIQCVGGKPPAPKELRVMLPVADTRTLQVQGASVLGEEAAEYWRTLHLRCGA
jgi:alpha-glucosidase